MESVLRRFGLKKGEPRDSEARQKLQRDLFAFSKCMEHGFPSKPSAVTYDPELDLMALGTRCGTLRIYGGPGVELSAHHDDFAAVFHIFMFDQGSVVTVCSDECLHLWEISTRDGISSLEHVRSLSLENNVKTVSASSLSRAGDQLLIGAESGHVYTVNLPSLRLSDRVIYQETVIQSAPEDFRVHPGAVEAVLQHPAQPEKLLIGYNRGLIVLWDCKKNRAEQMYNSAQQLEWLTFIADGKEFISCHGNGSYIIWNTASSLRPKEQANTPYGPYLCKSISKMVWKTTKTDCKVIRDPQTQKSKGYGFVCYVHKEDAEMAIAGMNGQWLGGRSLRTNWATGKGGGTTQRTQTSSQRELDYDDVYNQTGSTNCTVYCGGIQNNLTDALMRDHFGQFGTIQDVRVFKDKGFSFIKMESKDAAVRAIIATHGAQIEGYTVKCSWGKEMTDSHGQQSSSSSAQSHGNVAPPQSYYGSNQGYYNYWGYPGGYPPAPPYMPYMNPGGYGGQYPGYGMPPMPPQWPGAGPMPPAPPGTGNSTGQGQ